MLRAGTWRAHGLGWVALRTGGGDVYRDVKATTADGVSIWYSAAYLATFMVSFGGRVPVSDKADIEYCPEARGWGRGWCRPGFGRSATVGWESPWGRVAAAGPLGAGFEQSATVRRELP
jgi:hypothetical protein